MFSRETRLSTGKEACLDKKFIRNNDFIFRTIIDESVLVPVKQNVADFNCIYSLNPMGSMLWEMLDSPKTFLELLTAVLSEYDVDSAQASTDLTAFLNDMLKFEGVLEV